MCVCLHYLAVIQECIMTREREKEQGMWGRRTQRINRKNSGRN